jgi:hypothetical protein
MREDHVLKVKNLRYIVVGTGRCGTVYLAKLLSSIGIPCGHESIFSHDGIENALLRIKGELPVGVSEIGKMASEKEEEEWFEKGTTEIVADSSYMAAPFLNHECFKDTSVIHVVREPMKVINSFVSGLGYFTHRALKDDKLKDYHNFIYNYIPRLYEQMDPISRAALYYIKWNELIEKRSKDKNYLLYRIESDPHIVFSFLGISPTKFYSNTKSNHKLGLRDQYTKIDQIPDREIRERLKATRSRYYSIRHV